MALLGQSLANAHPYVLRLPEVYAARAAAARAAMASVRRVSSFSIFMRRVMLFRTALVERTLRPMLSVNYRESSRALLDLKRSSRRPERIQRERSKAVRIQLQLYASRLEVGHPIQSAA